MRQPEAGTIRTDVPSGPDRLPSARWHRTVSVGLGVRLAQPLPAQQT